MTRFGELVHLRSSHEDIAFALGHELGATEPDGASARLAGLAACVDSHGDALAELSQLCQIVRSEFEVQDNRFLLSQVLLRGAGHRDSLTILAACVAARAGLDIGVVSDGSKLYLAHRGLGAPFIADIERDEPLFDGRTVGVDLVWQCGHETAFATLRQVARRSNDTGDLSTELAALALLLSLPLSEKARTAYEDHHRHLLARLN